MLRSCLTDVISEPVPVAGEPSLREKSSPISSGTGVLFGSNAMNGDRNIGLTISGARTVVLPVVRNCVFCSTVIGNG